MNPFDQNTQGLNGIGSDLKKIGRSIDSHVRGATKNITNFAVDSIKNSYTTQGKFFTATVEGKLSKAGQNLVDGVKDQYELTEDAVKAQNHINIALNKATVEFLATDIGKIIAVIAICVAMVMGAGPIILAGLKEAMLVAKAGAQFAIKAGAKYIAKQLTVKALAKRAAGAVVKKVVGNYVGDKQAAAQAKAEAEYEAELTAKYEKEYEAMIEKQYQDTYGITFAAAIETPKAQVMGPDKMPIPYGLKYTNVNIPALSGSGRSGPSSKSIEVYLAAKKNILESYLKLKNEYLRQNPKIAAVYRANINGLAATQDELSQAASIIDGNERAQLMEALDIAVAEAEKISTSPEVLEVAAKLREQGHSEKDIERLYRESELYKDAAGTIMYRTAMPAVSSYVDLKEYPPEIAEDVKTVITKNVADRETSKAITQLNGGGSKSLLLIGGLAALAMMV